MRKSIFVTAAFVALGWSGAAAAHDVYAPYVEKGVFEVEARGQRLIGGAEDGEGEVSFEVGYGFTDRLHIGLVSEVEDEPGEERRAEAVGIEAIYEIGQIPGTGVDLGAYLEYEQRLHGESGVLEAKLLAARQFGPVEGLFNLIAEQPLTDRDGEGDWELGYAAQASVEAADDFEVGVQAIGGLGERGALGGRQQHWFGPMAEVELEHLPLPGELELQAAYLLPVSDGARDEADGQFRFAIEFERAF
ncbi:MAG TPA: hypothetical protein VF138_13195 [Caulobacteraceae bacterium]